MAKKCDYCGTMLLDDVTVCPACGAPVQPQTPPQQPAYQQPAYQQPAYQQPAYQQPAYQQPAYQQPAYQQPAYQQPAYQQPYQSPYPQNKPAKKGKGVLFAVVVILFAAVIGAILFFGFRDGGWFRRRTVDGRSVESLLAYAKRLEEQGNTAAAEAIYEKLPQGYGAERIEDSHQNIPVVEAADEMDLAQEIFGRTEGGKGE